MRSARQFLAVSFPWKRNAKLLLPTQAVPYLKQLVVGFPLRRPGFASGQHVGFLVDKAALGQVFSEYFGFPCQSFHHHNHPGLALVAAVPSGPNWTPNPTTPIKKNYFRYDWPKMTKLRCSSRYCSVDICRKMYF
jgi:hypothetical protein